jgi:hypothetical protein
MSEVSELNFHVYINLKMFHCKKSKKIDKY